MNVLCPQRACLRGTTAATVHLDALDEVAGVQEDLDWAPGEEDLHPGGRQGEASEGGSLKLVQTFIILPSSWSVSRPETRKLLDKSCCQDREAVSDWSQHVSASF